MAALSAACAYARGVPLGEGALARPPGCELAYEHAAPAEAQERWRQVGDVCVSGTRSYGAPRVEDVYQPGDALDALNERACALGGRIVTPIGLCANGRSSGLEFGVYVPKPGPELTPDRASPAPAPE